MVLRSFSDLLRFNLGVIILVKAELLFFYLTGEKSTVSFPFFTGFRMRMAIRE